MTITPNKENPIHKETQSWLRSVLSDVHFWVPALVLLGGLLLLRYVR